MSKPRGSIRHRLHSWYYERLRRKAVAASGQALPIRASDADNVTLARIIGNDLFPRHQEGQTLRNLAFILDNEPDFKGCNKLFVLNRIFEDDIRREAEKMVEDHGHEALVLPFIGEEYAAQSYDTSFFGGDDHFLSDAFAARDENQRDRERLWACAAKVRYAMNINGARNAALARGRQRGGWIFVLDGACFVRADAWEKFRLDLAAPPHVPYLVIPMQRMPSNDDVARVALTSNLDEEPQIAIHAHARESFDERYPYGIRDKVALLQRIGVPGPWDHWGRHPWLPAERGDAPERFLYRYANTSVLRLSSGVSAGQLERKGAEPVRYQSRNKAIFRTLAMLDRRFGTPDADRARQIMGIPSDLEYAP